MSSPSRNERRSAYSLRAGTEPAPRAAVRKLYCIECSGLKDARKVGKSATVYTLDCGHERILMSSEIVQERNERNGVN